MDATTSKKLVGSRSTPENPCEIFSLLRRDEKLVTVLPRSQLVLSQGSHVDLEDLTGLSQRMVPQLIFKYIQSVANRHQ